jgi:hypothetical protein
MLNGEQKGVVFIRIIAGYFEENGEMLGNIKKYDQYGVSFLTWIWPPARVGELGWL